MFIASAVSMIVAFLSTSWIFPSISMRGILHVSWIQTLFAFNMGFKFSPKML